VVGLHGYNKSKTMREERFECEEDLTWNNDWTLEQFFKSNLTPIPGNASLPLSFNFNLICQCSNAG
jgi:hypothetical protein